LGAVWIGSRGPRLWFERRIVLRLGFGGRDVADGLEQPLVVEPVEPFEGGVFDGLEVAPRATPVDHLGPFGEAQDRLVKAIDRLGQSVVIAVADTADRGLDADFGEAFGIVD
jgi:hypothetical protein